MRTFLGLSKKTLGIGFICYIGLLVLFKAIMECINGVMSTDLGDIPCSPTGFATSLYGIGLSFIGVVALLFIVYGGFLILTSQGNFEQLRKGKAYITYSIIGVVLAISGYALYQVLALDVVKIPGFSR